MSNIQKSLLENFIFFVKDFDTLPLTKQIDYFAYYITVNVGDFITAKDIYDCFDTLKLPRYSNVSAYLNSFSKGKNRKYIKNSSSNYVLVKTLITKIDTEFSKQTAPPPTDNLFSKEIVANTRGYILDIATQAMSCYDLCLYDACSVMMRKLLETLIIESFERYRLDSKIKDKNGDFYYLSDLIEQLLSESTWNITRNAKQGFKEIKKMGDLSAHNRRYCAKQQDIDKLKQDIRICTQELVNLIDYDNWKP